MSDYMRVKINLWRRIWAFFARFRATTSNSNLSFYMRVEINHLLRIWTFFLHNFVWQLLTLIFILQGLQAHKVIFDLQKTRSSNATFLNSKDIFVNSTKAQFRYYHLMFFILGYYLEKCYFPKLTTNFHFQIFSKTLICENHIQALLTARCNLRSL